MALDPLGDLSEHAVQQSKWSNQRKVGYLERSARDWKVVSASEMYPAEN